MHQMIRIVALIALPGSSTEFAPAAEQGVLVLPLASRISRSAMVRSADASRREITRRFANPVGDHRALLQLESSAVRMSSCGTSSSFSASGISSSVGKPQCPSSMASVSA